MPLIKIQTSLLSPSAPEVSALLKKLSAELSQQLGKSEAYVMTSFTSGVPMTFGGSADEPTCFVEIKNIGTMTPTQTQMMSQTFCQHLESELGIAKQRTYIEFADAERHLWGWNGKTFA
ncbi:MAG: phenylpyruvate tautomerase MIF-related protein [Cyanobacteria bacterium P01_C01_bin.89]